MAPRIDTAQVWLWGVMIGAVSWDKRGYSLFEYTPEFCDSGIQLAPLTMPLARTIYQFPDLNPATYRGLPGLLADALPDKFGNALIDQWLVREGIDREEFTPLDRLCYIGKRAMGALEFHPAVRRPSRLDHPLDLAAMVDLVSRILSARGELRGTLGRDETVDEEILRDILHVGVSAAGARAKAVVAYNESSGEVRSGQLDLAPGFEHWLLKFDGVRNNRDKELADSQGYGLMEYAYYRMATVAGIQMSECRLLPENDRHHFMTRRFDRTATGKKLHMQSLCAMAHYDFNLPGAYSVEQAMQVSRDLGLGMSAIEQLYRRALFNIVARNQDDHVKNIAFLMDSSGQWRLAPAFDLTFAYNPEGAFTSQHQMTLNGKRKDYQVEDFIALGKRFNLPRRQALAILEEVEAGVRLWPAEAAQLGVPEDQIEVRQQYHRFFLT
ncbi:type II toxin-antitoxin system HipA family toxin [Pseudomaricurvus alcaniphilus]|uniref:type II toxin-antitoxin system HipA family toxin n=1 Tax=Pseudomaricurvus alcaniphilus TaxID=1166482 RepID=UPI001407240F|nr:type II toxin-antitoxin system HipA family toxin [Pseudomaricurvus alcaniphilus]NHN35731.1 type II toxin-antitoxin system HipA family toxin [Pseudomaricurvus alcaniphilus]